ncbi:hypothetical protein SteCoe_26877 [Stentor coeruleus]|uniref:Uncharacterized protein n=1 Tax=Stentor coeruleus TaxID=5963 RepID=A0A1R2BBT3_9CILI|nr:hypothetical protein SteCoe_26877 [Stentor coeruleus]
MFRMMRLNINKVVPSRLKFHQKPEKNYDFIRYPYGNSPNRIVGLWKIDHSYDFGPEALDYEDHSMTMLHQRPTHWRSSWVIFCCIYSWCFLYFTWVELPFPGILWGQSTMDVQMNGIKYLNHNEEYHNWDKLLAEFKKNNVPEDEDEESDDNDLEEVQAEAE